MRHFNFGSDFIVNVRTAGLNWFSPFFSKFHSAKEWNLSDDYLMEVVVNLSHSLCSFCLVFLFMVVCSGGCYKMLKWLFIVSSFVHSRHNSGFPRRSYTTPENNDRYFIKGLNYANSLPCLAMIYVANFGASRSQI